MPGYVTNIEEETINNKHFRKVLFTAPHSQLVVMSLNPGEEIGEEIHDLDQFIVAQIVKTTGRCFLG